MTVRWISLGSWGSVILGVAVAGLVGFAGEASANSCRATCHQLFRGCAQDARVDLGTCRDGCTEAVCTIGCIQTFRQAIEGCRSGPNGRDACLASCPAASCEAGCAMDFVNCSRQANDAFRFDCRGARCDQPFGEQRLVCEELVPAERRDCIVDANRTRADCLRTCADERRQDQEVCRTARAECVATCQ